MSRCAAFFLVLAVCKQEVLAEDPIISAEAKLKAHMFKDYDIERRPVKDHTKAVDVTVQLSLIYLTVNEVADTITVQNLLSLSWDDKFLSWSPDNYSGIEYSEADSAKIWQPRLSLQNADIKAQGYDDRFATTCRIHYTGNVRCVPHVSHTALCEPDSRCWPYDDLNCTLMFNSWAYTGEKININFGPKPVEYEELYYENQDWSVNTVTTSKKVGKYTPNETFPSLRFSFLLQRRSATHAAIVIIPAICLAVLTTSCDLLAPRALRLGMSMTSLLIQIIYLLGISRYVPSHGDDPAYIIMFFRDSVLITTVTILTTMAMMSVTKFTRPPPRLVAIVVSIAKTGLATMVTFGQIDLTNLSPILAEDGENSRTELERTANMEWQKFASIIDNLFFLIIAFTYIILIFNYVLH